MQHIVPYLFYLDAPAAIEFLCKAFGFAEEFRHLMPDGKIGHAQLSHEGGTIMLASVWPETGMASPMDLPGVHGQIYCRVADADSHYQKAREAGATIAAIPLDQYGERSYRALDTEGHRWIFASPKRSSG
jgi:PhnB protein